MRNPYETLGVPPTSTDEEIKSAYIKLVKNFHPDKYQDDPFYDVAEELMKEVNKAYSELMTNRSAYANCDSIYTNKKTSKKHAYNQPYQREQTQSYTQRYVRPLGPRLYKHSDNGLALVLMFMVFVYWHLSFLYGLFYHL